MKCADGDFLEFHPFTNLKAQILEVWTSAPDSAKKYQAAMKSRDLYYRPKLTFRLGVDLRRRRQIRDIHKYAYN